MASAEIQLAGRCLLVRGPLMKNQAWLATGHLDHGGQEQRNTSAEWGQYLKNDFLIVLTGG